MAPTWRHDDASIPDTTLLFRRVSRHPDALITDAISGRKSLGLAVFNYADSDGMSVYLSTMMKSELVGCRELIDWTSDQGLACVSLATVRRSRVGKEFTRKEARIDALSAGTVAPGAARETPGGVIASEAEDFPDDVRVRRSHGLVRITDIPGTAEAKRLWGPFRIKLIQASWLTLERSGPWSSNVVGAAPIRR